MSDGQQASWFFGLIGFSYPEWARTLYINQGRPSTGDVNRCGHLLSRYAVHFNAVEINTTFYGIPSADSVRMWAEATPPDFRFCVKMPRDVTHGPTPPGAFAFPDGSPTGHLFLESTLDAAGRFFETIQALGAKLGSVLLQFPRKFTVDRRDELAEFLDRLRCDLPFAVEFRNENWWMPEVASMLRDRKVSWAATDESPRQEAKPGQPSKGTRMRYVRRMVSTSEFLYVRLLGKHGQFLDRTKEQFDPSPRLDWWNERLQKFLDGNPSVRTVYAFFDNDFAGHAPATARRFMRTRGIPLSELNTEERDDPMLFGS
ncbi:MAG: DUF72 domain-containing protein [Phycisphaerales bacterium]